MHQRQQHQKYFGAPKKRYTVSVTSTYSSSIGESGLTGGRRVNVNPEKRIPKKHKYITPTSLYPFLPGNKKLLNEDNDDNPETTDTSLSGKDDISHTSKDNFTEKTNLKASEAPASDALASDT